MRQATCTGSILKKQDAKYSIVKGLFQEASVFKGLIEQERQGSRT